MLHSALAKLNLIEVAKHATFNQADQAFLGILVIFVDLLVLDHFRSLLLPITQTRGVDNKCSIVESYKMAEGIDRNNEGMLSSTTSRSMFTKS